MPPARGAGGRDPAWATDRVYGRFRRVGALKRLLPGGWLGKHWPGLCGLGSDGEQGSTPRRAETRPGSRGGRQQSHEQPAPYRCPHRSWYRRGPSTSQTLGIGQQTPTLTHPGSAGAQCIRSQGPARRHPGCRVGGNSVPTSSPGRRVTGPDSCSTGEKSQRRA